MRESAWLLVLVACGDDGGGTSAPDAPVNATAHEFCVAETNRYRVMDGKPPVTRSPQLEDYANTGAMVDHDASPHDHFQQTSGGGIAFAENECPRWNLSMTGGDLKQLVTACIQAFYDEGPGSGAAHGHYNNMMGTYATLGCGLYEAAGRVTIIQDFGR